jgi:glycosyltransferase involved in cell wall biosynthesis
LFDDVKGGADYFMKRRKIEKKLKEGIYNHDIIIIRFPATISIFAASICNRSNIPYVAEVVGCSWDANWNYGGLAPRLIAPYSYFNMKKVVKKAFASIYVTKEFLQKRYPTSAKINNYASNVILKEIDDHALSNRLTKIKGYPIKKYRIGIIGNIAVQYKGYDVLLAAVNKLPIEIKDKIKVSFVGGGDPSYLKSIITKFNLNDQCEIVGKLKAGKEIFNFLDDIDLYIHPSKQEGLPRVVIEAMSRACPVLASATAGTPELIDFPFIHTPGDIIKLSNDIQKLLKGTYNLLEIAKTNFETSKSYKFSSLERRRYDFFNQVKLTSCN